MDITSTSDTEDPDVKKLSKLKNELHSICEQLSFLGEESMFLSVNLEDATPFFSGSRLGQAFLFEKSEVIGMFYDYCKLSYSSHHSLTKKRSSSESSTTSDKSLTAVNNINVSKDSSVIEQIKYAKTETKIDKREKYMKYQLRRKSKKSNRLKHSKSRSNKSDENERESDQDGETPDVTPSDKKNFQDSRKINVQSVMSTGFQTSFHSYLAGKTKDSGKHSDSEPDSDSTIDIDYNSIESSNSCVTSNKGSSIKSFESNIACRNFVDNTNSKFSSSVLNYTQRDNSNCDSAAKRDSTSKSNSEAKRDSILKYNSAADSESVSKNDSAVKTDSVLNDISAAKCNMQTRVNCLQQKPVSELAKPESSNISPLNISRNSCSLVQSELPKTAVSAMILTGSISQSESKSQTSTEAKNVCQSASESGTSSEANKLSELAYDSGNSSELENLSRSASNSRNSSELENLSRSASNSRNSSELENLSRSASNSRNSSELENASRSAFKSWNSSDKTDKVRQLVLNSIVSSEVICISDSDGDDGNEIEADDDVQITKVIPSQLEIFKNFQQGTVLRASPGSNMIIFQASPVKCINSEQINSERPSNMQVLNFDCEQEKRPSNMQVLNFDSVQEKRPSNMQVLNFDSEQEKRPSNMQVLNFDSEQENVQIITGEQEEVQTRSCEQVHEEVKEKEISDTISGLKECSVVLSRKDIISCSSGNATETTYNCQLCSKSFESLNGLKRHEDNCETAFEKSYRCKFCGIKVFNSDSLRIHLKLHK